MWPNSQFAMDLVTITVEILNGKLQEPAPLETLAHCQNVASLSLHSIVITLIDVHLHWMNWFYLLILVAAPVIILIGCIVLYFCHLPLMFFNYVYVNSFFSHTPRTWNLLHAECFPLVYDLIGFNFRVNSHLFSLDSFKNNFPLYFHLFNFLQLHAS